MILCQITDLHIKPERKLAYGVVDTATMLERCVAQIVRLPQRPDAVIATGDLVDGGTPAEYSLLRDLLSPLTMPLYLMPGNHDERRAMRQVFDDHLYLQSTSAFIQYVINDFPLRVIVLDTVIPGESGGTLCDERLTWLERALAESGKPTVVALHHPPFVTGIGHMDRIALDSSIKLEQIVARYPQVSASSPVICIVQSRCVSAELLPVRAQARRIKWCSISRVTAQTISSWSHPRFSCIGGTANGWSLTPSTSATLALRIRSVKADS